MKMDLRKIRTLLQLMNEHQLVEMELEEEGLKIKFSKQISMTPGQLAGSALQGPVVLPPACENSEKTELPVREDFQVIASPMPGTFYVASAPDQPPFVKVGDLVERDTVVCIIEAMKVMNEIKAECSGKLVEILVENGEPVEFGKALFRVV
jgi:acetyl-CoA carboxylase biotin carboxyl carrier protein